MIDIHCHILPSLDDGPAEIGESLGMAEMAAADGITSIVATPHFTYGEGPGAEEISRRVEVLRTRMKEKGLKVTLTPGADIRLSYELLKAIERRDIPTINGSRYFLLELPPVVPPNLGDFVYAAISNGLMPVITHPERNYGLLAVPEKMDSLRNSGVLFQITAMSITGGFGMGIERFARRMVKKGFVDFVATDAHDMTGRRPLLSHCYKQMARMIGPKDLKKIFFDNPAAVLEDRDIC